MKTSLNAPRPEDLACTPMGEWTEVDPFPRHDTRFSYVSGNPESETIRVRYFRNSDGRFSGKAWFGPRAEGPPGHAHGGSQAALLDEVMGAVAWLSGHPVLAARIQIDFRAPLPLGTIVTLEGRIDRVEGKKVHARGELRGSDGMVFSEGTGLFIVIEPEKFADRLAKR